MMRFSRATCIVAVLAALLSLSNAVHLRRKLNFDLPHEFSDPDQKFIEGDPRLPPSAAEHGGVIPFQGSAIANHLAQVEVDDWKVNHGFVNDVFGDPNALNNPYAWKKSLTVNTDMALKYHWSPLQYSWAKKLAQRNDTDEITPVKYTDSTIPSDDDPVSRRSVPTLDFGDSRRAMQILWPNRKYRGMADPEAREIIKRNRRSLFPMNDLFPVPMHKVIKVPTRTSGSSSRYLGSRKDWGRYIRGMQDTSLTRVTDPAILDVNSKGLTDSYEAQIDPPMGSPLPDGSVDPSLKDIPAFDLGFHVLRNREFLNPHYRGMDNRSKTQIRQEIPENPFSPKDANYEGLMMMEPPSDRMGQSKPVNNGGSPYEGVAVIPR